MPQTESWTIGRLLTWTTDYLKKRGSESPRLEAEMLLAEARNCKRIELYTAFEEDPGDQIRTAFRELVRRRAEGTPVAYLVGRREFYSLDFRVSDAVLIPRPETEFLVIDLLDLAKPLSAAGSPLEIADVGTGSGIIAVCAAKKLKTSQVTAIDISPVALEIARANAATHQVQDRIAFFQADLLSAIPAEPRFDFIASNPPYVSEAEFERLPEDVRKFEPRLALVAGPTGAEVAERLIEQAAARLKPGGWLLMEISPMIHARLVARLKEDSRYESVGTTKDLAGLARIVKARRTAT